MPRFGPVMVRFGPPLRFTASNGRRSGRQLRGVSEDMREAVARLYTPWDPRRRPRAATEGEARP
jgi:hypothetical protein